jgi:hypothetical protein
LRSGKKHDYFLPIKEERKKITFWPVELCSVNFFKQPKLMNASFFAQSSVPALYVPVRTQTPKNNALSVGQLLDVELGLYLLSQLLPTAPPDALPTLIGNKEASLPDRPTWTSRQQKYLKRGRLLLGHCLQPAIWNSLIERYAAETTTLSAYDVSRDRSRFGQKTVGFSRNRLAVLRKMLA